VSGHLPPGATLEGAARAELLGHARACAECRARLLADDPVALFAFLDQVEIPESILASVSAGVRAGLDRESPRRDWFRPAVAWAAAAAMATALLVPAALRYQPVVPRAATVEVAPRAGIEALRTPGTAQVLDLTVGDTQVVMIFDAELSL
jgi:hypothetical protein